jgi:predicted PurR-regulated permease PerM
MIDTHEEFAARVRTVVGLAMLALLAATVVALAADVLLIFFGGILLAILLRGVADQTSAQFGLSPRVALTIVLLAFAIVVVLGGWLLATQIADQLEALGASLSQAWQQLKEQLQREMWGRQLLALVARARDDTAGADVASGVSHAFATTLGALVNAAVVLFIGAYVAVNPRWYRRGMIRLVSPARRARAREILDAIGHTLRWWLFGRAIGMIIVGIATGVGLWLLGVPFAAGLGVIAAALDFVPYAGPILAAAPGVLVALSDGTTQVLYVLLLYFAIQLIEGYVLTPLIEQRSVHLPPALTIGAQVLLGVLVGPIGVAVATPLTAVIVVLIEKLYVEDKLEGEES